MTNGQGGGGRDKRDRDGGGGRSFGRGGGDRGGRPSKRRVDPFLADKTLKIDWRDPQLLARFITERGKIVPRRMTGVCAKNQRRLKKAIKRARHMALLPYGGHQVSMRNL